MAAIAKTNRAELRKDEAAIAARTKADPGARGGPKSSGAAPGLADQTVAGIIGWLPELGRISNEAAGALLCATPYDDEGDGAKASASIKAGRHNSAATCCFV